MSNQPAYMDDYEEDLSTFKGNPNLKGVNETHEFTHEQIKEYAKCAADPIYFTKNYVQIITVDHGLQKFNLHDYQEDLINKATNNRFVICKMPRQTGKTTTVCAMLLWYVLFHEDYRVAILANKQDQSIEILERVQLAYEHLPKWLQQGVVGWGAKSISLENRSKITAAATSSSSVRGKTFNLIYLDEFAHINTNLQDNFFKSTYPTISSGKTTKVFITSTPNGMELFYQLWTKAIEGRNTYIPIEVNWWQVPGRDEKWKQEEIDNTSPEQFRQEHECEFLGSVNTLIDPNVLRNLTFVEPLRSSENIKYYQMPKQGHNYCIAVDTSQGLGQDYSAFLVLDITEVPYKICAVFRSNMVMPEIYPNYIFNIAKQFNDADVLFELNDQGAYVAKTLHFDFEYENILMSSVKGAKGQVLGGGFGNNTQLGVKTTKAVKRIGCSTLKSMIESHKILIQDFDVIRELSTFVSNKQSYEAQPGNNDDTTMCLVIFAWMTTQNYFKELTNTDMRHLIEQENMKMIEEEMTPFGIMDDGMEDDFEEVVDLGGGDFDNFLRS